MTVDLEPRVCEECGAAYEPKRRDQRCCSHDCIVTLSNRERSQQFVSKKESKVCERCGTEFDVVDWYSATKKRFCSLSCSSQEAWDSGEHGRAVDKIRRACIICEKEMEVVPSRAKTRITCSVECRAKWQSESGVTSGQNSGSWGGGSDTWWKRKARERDDFTCQLCGVRDDGAKTHAHHMIPKAAGGTNDLSNLITLCNRCHRNKEHEMFVLLIGKYPKAARNLVRHLYPKVKDVDQSSLSPVGGPYKKRWRDEQRRLGRCVECGKPAVDGETLCQQHKEDNKARRDRWLNKVSEP